MRVSVRSILAAALAVTGLALLAADKAQAQISIPDDFARTRSSLDRMHGPRVEPPVSWSFKEIHPEFRTEERMTRTDTLTVLPLGDGFLAHQSSSFYPVPNTKLRYEGVFAGIRVDALTLVMAGAWRTKYGREGQPTLSSEPTIGLQLTVTPSR